MIKYLLINIFIVVNENRINNYKYKSTWEYSPDSFKSFIKSFEKFIKSEVKKYDDKSGLEDIKLNKNDYKILYELYKNTVKVHIKFIFYYYTCIHFTN